MPLLKFQFRKISQPSDESSIYHVLRDPMPQKGKEKYSQPEDRSAHGTQRLLSSLVPIPLA